MQVSQKLFFSAENLIAPSSSAVLQSSELPRALVTPDPLRQGKAAFSITAVRTPVKAKIKGLTACLAENYSATKRQSNPISQLLIFAAGSNSLSFFRGIPETELAASGMEYNGEPVSSYSDLDGKTVSSNSLNSIADNIVSFRPVISAAGELEFLLFPRYNRKKPSILDSLQRIHWVSFYEYFTSGAEISIPDQTKYLLLFCYATLPIVPSSFVTSTGSIYTSYYINMELDET